MNYINAEEFLKCSKEVRDIFINWWQPEFGDLFLEDYWDIDSIINIVGCVPINKKHFEDYEGKTHYKTDLVLPLLAEGQLRQFIENNSGMEDTTIDIVINGYNDIEEKREYTLTIYGYNNQEGFTDSKQYDVTGENLLQVYWQVACQIAQEEVNNQKQSIIYTNEQGLPVVKGGGKTMREMYNDEYR
ncbi:TPA: hypothetical protein ACXDAZ_002529 [Clostridium botulinum]